MISIRIASLVFLASIMVATIKAGPTPKNKEPYRFDPSTGQLHVNTPYLHQSSDNPEQQPSISTDIEIHPGDGVRQLPLVYKDGKPVQGYVGAPLGDKRDLRDLPEDPSDPFIATRKGKLRPMYVEENYPDEHIVPYPEISESAKIEK